MGRRPAHDAAPGTQVGTALTWWTAPFTWRAEHFVDVLRQALPGAHDRPRVVVLDNASIHRSKKVKAAAPELAQQNIHLYYLPAYSPELNASERIFRRVKHQAMPRPSGRSTHNSHLPIYWGQMLTTSRAGLRMRPPC